MSDSYTAVATLMAMLFLAVLLPPLGSAASHAQSVDDGAFATQMTPRCLVMALAGARSMPISPRPCSSMATSTDAAGPGPPDGRTAPATDSRLDLHRAFA